MFFSNKTISFTIVSLFFGTILIVTSLDSCKKFPEGFLHITTDTVEINVDRTYKLTGSIESIGEESITQHGFCWSVTSNPTTAAEKTQLGAADSKGSFSSIITDLSLSTRYYVKFYVRTSSGTEYGKEKSFTTPSPNLPALTTNIVTNITQDSAQSGGVISDDGGASITARGVCWDTNTAPTIEQGHTTDGTGTGSYTSNITGLDCSTKYYIRAYATNEAGTGYGDTISFTTIECAPGLPIVVTSTIEGITDNSAQGGGNVIDKGLSSVTARGVCWSESSNPTIDGGHTTDGLGVGIFTSSLSGLTANTTYVVRAYATNGQGTGYGNEESFTTLSVSGETVTDYDGNVYQTVQIGEQVWMQENLKVTHYSNGTEIPLVENDLSWAALTEIDRAYCWYDNSTINRDVYGGLYSWPAAMNGVASSTSNPSGVQGVCPTNWHLPSDEEWKQMEMYLGMSRAEADAFDDRGTDEGGKLKEGGTTHWGIPNTGATNESGFTALPGGFRAANAYDSFTDIKTVGTFLTTTEGIFDDELSIARGLVSDREVIIRFYYPKSSGQSIRCVKGEASLFPPNVSTTIISNITESSAESGGEVTSDGGAAVSAFGVCWSTSESPTLSDEFTTDGTGTGTFTSSIDGLECNTTYYLRAYATNSEGTAYGSPVSFTTNQCPVLPTVTTTAITNVTATSAEVGGNVTHDAGIDVTERGIYYGTSSDPMTTGQKISKGYGTGIFSVSLSNLSTETTYYIVAYATNSYGTSFGNVLSFYTGTPLPSTHLDSLALVTLYNDCNGPGWGDANANWLNGSLDNWAGVTVAYVTGSRRVIYVAFNNMTLTGTLPAALGNLTELSGKVEMNDQPGLTGVFPAFIWNWTKVERMQIRKCGFSSIDVTGIDKMVNLFELNTIGTPFEGEIPVEIFELPLIKDIYLEDGMWTSLPADLPIPTNTPLRRFYINGNQFYDLPDLTGMIWADGSKIKVRNNYLTFEDLQPNMWIADDVNVAGFEFSPQALVPNMETITVDEGQSTSIGVTCEGSDNTYLWMINGDTLEGATTDQIDIASASMADAGEYYCIIQNESVPELDIVSDTITVIVNID